ncbi:hypothetical protein QDG88_04855 [Pseudoalteromonas piscicida]|uniref:hypothetical protein n=1 Tax=Pseudoalteromonas piscicida TaxID=43662 RepID=UPI002739F98B|nr:hypothetical protein [Pseudoalteromonas piscicida]MDP4487281.1 hypothetical protein [Pseudoalteromonas piscicida]
MIISSIPRAKAQRKLQQGLLRIFQEISSWNCLVFNDIDSIKKHFINNMYSSFGFALFEILVASEFIQATQLQIDTTYMKLTYTE